MNEYPNNTVLRYGDDDLIHVVSAMMGNPWCDDDEQKMRKPDGDTPSPTEAPEEWCPGCVEALENPDG